MDAKKKRFSKSTVRALAWAAGGVAFAVPWVAFEVVPPAAASSQATSPQVIVVPAGSKVTVLSAPSNGAGVKVIHSTSSAPTTATAPTVKSVPVTTTGASAPPP
ncbi:MAG: hypothetical protein ACXWZU_11030 [Actinomycetota bacterium]